MENTIAPPFTADPYGAFVKIVDLVPHVDYCNLLELRRILDAFLQMRKVYPFPGNTITIPF